MKVLYHSGAMHRTHEHIQYEEAIRWLNEAGKEARIYRHKAGAIHAIYGIKTYDHRSGELIELKIYSPALLSYDNAEFNNVINEYIAEHPGDIILAHHNH